jgi:hypothetical protein
MKQNETEWNKLKQIEAEYQHGTHHREISDQIRAAPAQSTHKRRHMFFERCRMLIEECHMLPERYHM